MGLWFAKIIKTKVLVGAFNREKALVGAFSKIVKTDESFATLLVSHVTGI